VVIRYKFSGDLASKAGQANPGVCALDASNGAVLATGGRFPCVDCAEGLC
jgi:hypothetical protein